AVACGNANAEVTVIPLQTYYILITDASNIGGALSISISGDIQVPAPAMSMLLEANVSSVDEPGASVMFTATVTSDSIFETINLTSISDDTLGNLGIACGLPVSLAPGASTICNFSDTINGQAFASVTNTVTASSTTNTGATLNAESSVTLTVTDRPSSLQVTKTPDVLEILAPGGIVGFTVTIENTSAVDDVTINNVTDSIFGDITSSCTPTIPTTLAPSEVIVCEFEGNVSGAGGTIHINTIFVIGIDDDQILVEADDTAQVQIQCNLSQASNDLEAILDAPYNTTTISNSTEGCAYDVGIASYRRVRIRGGHNLWELHDFTTSYLSPDSNATLSVELPQCNSVSEITLNFGPNEADWLPIIGDWDGDNIDDLGLYRDGQWILRDTTLTDTVVSFGEAGWLPIVGDWDGDNVDDLGLYRDDIWQLWNAGNVTILTSATGLSNALPVAADWNNDGLDMPALYANGQWVLFHVLASLVNGTPIAFGPTDVGWLPLVGDWNANTTESIGLFNNGLWRMRDTLSDGRSDIGFNFGLADSAWLPVAGFNTTLNDLAALDNGNGVTTLPDTVTPEATMVVTEPPEITPEATAVVTEPPEITPEVTSDVTATQESTQEVILEATLNVTELSPVTQEPVATQEVTPEVIPESVITVEVTPEPVATVEVIPESVITVEVTPEPVATVEVIPESVITVEPIATVETVVTVVTEESPVVLPPPVVICHTTGNLDDPANWIILTLPPSALDNHFDENLNPRQGHDGDFIIDASRPIGLCEPPTASGG
ncbi:MAG: hypothetical protein Q9P01_13305, partial [Anaerolineae bacterium]|nr:hypothetical protein [Anaerolineae bacterium]